MTSLSMRGRAVAVVAVVLALCVSALAQEDEECFFCHGDPEFSVELDDGTVRSLFVDEEAYGQTVHGELGCVGCHADITEVPHEEDLEPVSCEVCHDEGEEYAMSLHGQAVERGDPLAPYCYDCHTKHDIRPASDPKSAINNINIPQTCGNCHAEDAPVAKSRNISQHDILRNYEQSIHGEGMLKKGLTVTAVCTSCHTAHSVLPHTDPKSTINRDNVVATCTQCHALIEEVHRKVIDGELWESEPHKVPICIDCHQPHEARRVFYDEGVSDRDCMTCHDKAVEATGRVLQAVDPAVMAGSTHATVRCAQCHTGADAALHRPCEPIVGTVDCSICHAEEVEQHQRSIHGQLVERGDPDAPVCLDCHAGHGTQSRSDPASPTFSQNIPNLCGRCHQDGEAAAARHHSTQENVVDNYAMSIHGKGLLESGLTVTATCVDCHGSHSPLPASDPESSVNPANIPATCGKCHHGIQEQFEASIHSRLVTDTAEDLPVCSSCHSAHSISRTDEGAFKLEILQTCGKCHEDVAETYFQTYHGKVSQLGSEVAAKCHDCHGAHDVLPPTDPNSHLSRDNIVETCAKCHEGSHRRFAGYLTHATHHDPKKYPALFYTFWAMTALLTGTFVFFGLHTLAWFPHSLRAKLKERSEPCAEPDNRIFLRFDPIVRQLHFVLIISFFGLAITGMTLKFSYMPWAYWLINVLGGTQSAGVIHRICAVVLLVLFAVHLLVVVNRKRKSGRTWLQLLMSPASLMPKPSDLSDFIATVKWFTRRGPRPKYGHWTYWEKFDYFAVFWGVAIIGSTGLILWFPEFATRFMPGWFINVATIIHSDEALLATGFIFTVHFFNTHFRPEKFPMDMVMFTGRMTVEELKEERPAYYEELVESGELEKRITLESPKEFRFWAAALGTMALVVGLGLVLFIIWSMVFGYK